MLIIVLLLHFLESHNRHLCYAQPGHPLLHVLRRFPDCRIRPKKVIFLP